MDCNKYVESLGAFVDGELTAGENAAIEAHLEKCGECSELCRELRELSELTRGLCEPVPEEFTKRWKNALAEQRKPIGVNTRVFGAVAAAALVVALATGLYPVIAAPMQAGSASEADVVAGSVPAMDEKYAVNSASAENAEAAEAETAEITTEEAADSTDAQAPEEKPERARSLSADAGQGAETGAFDSDAFVGAPSEAQALPEAAAYLMTPEIQEDAAPAEAQAEEPAQPEADESAALFLAEAESMPEAGAQENQGAEALPQTANHAQAAQAVQNEPLDYVDRINLYANGTDLETVRRDWAELLKKYGCSDPGSHMYTSDAERLAADVEALGYSIEYFTTNDDIPFGVVIHD